MSSITTVLASLAAIVTVIAGVLSISRALRPQREAKIVNPLNGSHVGGRHLEVTGTLPRPKSGHKYWIAIQPSDCRGAGVWWPQGAPLTVHRNGTWTLRRATLGRDGTLGEERDTGKTYTIQLVEVPPDAQPAFDEAARRGERLRLPASSIHLHGIDVVRDHTGR